MHCNDSCITRMHMNMHLIRKSKDSVYGISVCKVLSISKGYYRVKKITSFMHETVNRGKKNIFFLNTLMPVKHSIHGLSFIAMIIHVCITVMCKVWHAHQSHMLIYFFVRIPLLYRWNSVQIVFSADMSVNVHHNNGKTCRNVAQNIGSHSNDIARSQCH